MSAEAGSSRSGAQVATASTDAPPIVKGASLLIALRLEQRPVLLIGGGAVASSRLYFLLEAGAHITLVSPTVCPEIQHRLNTNAEDITWLPRAYLGRSDPIKVENFALVLTAIDNNPLSLEVCEMCREKRVTVNVADVPPQCDFYFGAQLRRGPVQVMVSTQGQGPKIGVMVRDRIAGVLPDNLESAVQGVGNLRKELRVRAPGVGGELSKRRMEWMKATCDVWTLDDMVELCDEGVRRRLLDEGWEKHKVVGPRESGVGGGAARAWAIPTFVATWWKRGLREVLLGAALGSLVTAQILKRATR